MAAWLHHLVINRLFAQDTHLISADDQLHFPAAKVAGDFYLARNSSRFTDSANNNQMLFFVEAALAFLKQAANSKAKKSPLETAIDFLTKSISYENEHELRQLYGNVADIGLILQNDFAGQCENLLLPAWQAAHEL